MANFIVDTSVVMKHLLNEEFTENADRLFDQLGDGISLYIPSFCLVECTNVLWTRVRFDSMPESEALILLEDLANLPFAITSVEELLPRALQIGLAHQLAIYDSIYIALAETYHYPLITADARQESVAKAVGVTIKPITDF